jgi:threonylcarbamoyladenosine tRNA methylthiotransferase MtaB
MKIFLDSIGCRLNQAEIETMARQFRTLGHEIVASAEEADLAVINTCTVTQAAASDSRGKIRKAARAGIKQIVVTGCWATMHPKQAANFPFPTQVVTNNEKDDLVSNILDIPIDMIVHQNNSRIPIPGTRQRTRAFIKVQDGCDNHCTFCITTIARGAGISRSIDQILDDIQAAESANEIVLTGVHLGSWGKDLGNNLDLTDLIQTILDRTEVPRIRLSSIEPWDLNDVFFQLWENSRLCRHLHLPLQSGYDATLKRMGRKTTTKEYASLIESARSNIPNIAITTDIITGFPGETDSEFEESLQFVRGLNFSGGHVFTYSPRPGTAASKMENQIPYAIRKERNARMRTVFAQTAYQYQEKYLGKMLPVLWESATKLQFQEWRLTGLTSNYLRVFSLSNYPIENVISSVKLDRISKNGLWGQIQS